MSSAPSHEKLTAPEAAARLAASRSSSSSSSSSLELDLASLASAAAAAAPGLPAEALAALGSYRVPLISADGGCSLPDKLQPEPFGILSELTEGQGEAPACAVVRLLALRSLCEALAAATGAQWCGVYELVPASERSVAWGGSSAAPCLLKLAYTGAPSRPYFPLTAEFAEHSNNSTVGLTGCTAVYHDVRALRKEVPYYSCDGKVRSEVCSPIFDSSGSIIGIMDVEAFHPQAFLEPAKLAAVLAACEALGASSLLKKQQ
jgi:putative methionine-R-sulfoxide reductase with GAF domain